MRIRNLILLAVISLAFGPPVFGQGVPPLPTAAPDAPPISGDLPGISNSPSLKIAPARYETDITAGQTKQGVVDVFNVSKQAITVQPEVENARMVGMTGELEFFTGPNPYKLNGFVKFDTTSFVLQPGEARRVAFAIVVPPGVYPGGYYGALFMKLVAGQPSGESAAVGVGGRVGTLLMITVPGEVQRQTQIDSLTVGGGLLSDHHPTVTAYRNTGNMDNQPLGVAVRPTGELRLKNTFGRVIRRQAVTGEVVFPGAGREQQFALSKPLWFGRYTVELELAAAPGVSPSVKTISFWSFSPLALLILVLVVGVGAIVTRWWRERRSRKQLTPPTFPQTPSLLDDADHADPLDRPPHGP